MCDFAHSPLFRNFFFHFKRLTRLALHGPELAITAHVRTTETNPVREEEVVKAKKSKAIRPWMTSTDVEIPTDRLKEICKSWDRPMWDAYLNWFESSRKESLIPHDQYEDLSNRETQTIFEKFDQSSNEEVRTTCENLLASLPPREEEVLRMKFFEGRTEREIAALGGISKSSVHDLKNSALSRLRRGQQGNDPGTRRLMRGDGADDVYASVWTRPLFVAKEEAKLSRHTSEQIDAFKQIEHSALRTAISELTETQRRIVYLKFWCDCDTGEIAREMKYGVNVVEQILEAAISTLKQKIAVMETGVLPGSGPSCA